MRRKSLLVDGGCMLSNAVTAGTLSKQLQGIGQVQIARHNTVILIALA